MTDLFNMVIAATLLLLALGIVGEDEYQQEIAEARHYCEMVGSGLWPHFKTEITC
tara:strand:- start:1060 stop:1224 length:165 start_codon:yes stop_codon:yes gene_type:complete